MCIVLFTTAHPDYALILIDNRDEFVLRPTSQPHWWKHPATGHQILSSRDLHRKEQGTWLGITKDGLLAVLTNYRESKADEVMGAKSRGGMVTAWLGGIAEGSVKDGVEKLVADGGTKGVGGFSMVCGKLRRKGEGIAIVSNRAAEASQVPFLGKEKGEVHGLSNAVFDPTDEWPKVRSGKALLQNLMDSAPSRNLSQQDLITELFSILDTDTLPSASPETPFHIVVDSLRHSIFVPAFGDEERQRCMSKARAKGLSALTPPSPPSSGDDDEDKTSKANGKTVLAQGERPDPAQGGGAAGKPAAFEAGTYGTQRQTVMMVDWNGNVTFVERMLWDENGNAVPRGEGDTTFRFKVDGWDD